MLPCWRMQAHITISCCSILLLCAMNLSHTHTHTHTYTIGAQNSRPHNDGYICLEVSSRVPSIHQKDRKEKNRIYRGRSAFVNPTAVSKYRTKGTLLVYLEAVVLIAMSVNITLFTFYGSCLCLKGLSGLDTHGVRHLGCFCRALHASPDLCLYFS